MKEKLVQVICDSLREEKAHLSNRFATFIEQAGMLHNFRYGCSGYF